DHNVVSARFALNHFVDPHKLRGNVFAAGFLIHPIDKRWRKTVFLSKKYSDFFHRLLRVFPSGAKRSRGIPWSNLCVMPRESLDFARDDEETRGVDSH